MNGVYQSVMINYRCVLICFDLLLNAMKEPWLVPDNNIPSRSFICSVPRFQDPFGLTCLSACCRGEREDRVSLEERLYTLYIPTFVTTQVLSSHSFKSLFTWEMKFIIWKSWGHPAGGKEEPSHQSAAENCKLASCIAISSALRAPVSSWV